MDQKERNVSMKEFRTGYSRILIRTDLLGGDIGIPQLSIGRSGRFDRKGAAINVVTNNDRHILRDIEQFYNAQIQEMPLDGPDLI
ncbi:unnamed protein product [Rotaria sp. Silwood2]|nr:unnamed protein product [Rotaria sp. Silwood2]